MKKALSILLAMGMTVGMVAGCGDTADNSSVADNSAAASTEAGTDGTQAAASAADIKVGVIYIGDENEGYTAAHMAGIDEMAANLGLSDDQIIEKTTIPEDESCYDAAVDLADQGCNIIFATSFGHETYILQAAQEYPDIQFCHATGYQAASSGLSNMHNYFDAIYEARYVSGVVAGMKLNEMIENGDITADQAKIGYVGAFPYAEVISGFTSFYLGAKSVCESVTMEVQYTNSWADMTAEGEVANQLIADNCVLISQHADTTGAPSACETAGVPNVSYNGSTASACPNTFLVSSKINWEPYFEYAINCVAAGNAIDTDWAGSLDTGSVELTELGSSVAAGTQEAIDAAKADLIAGKVHVFDITTFTVEGAELSSFEADVDTDPDYTPDHEVVLDGYFHESDIQFRSAPYFNVQIDGINLLDTAF